MRLRSTRWFAILALACAAGCASQQPAVPANVSVGAKSATLPAPIARPGNAAPELIAASFSSLNVGRGETWSGRFTTGTNVASLEVRTNLFSIDVPRTGFGRFAFSVNIYDVPSIFVRKYALRIIARNTAGDEIEENAPFEIH